MSGTIIRKTTVLLSVLCETGLVFNFWPSSAQKHFLDWPPGYHVPSEATTVLFGLLMPLFTTAMLFVPIPPKFLLICTGLLHVLVAQVASMTFRLSKEVNPAVWHRDENGRQLQQQDDSSGRTISKAWRTSSGQEVVQAFALKRWQVLVVYMLPTTSAAMYDATFQLFACSLQASDTMNTPHRAVDDVIEWIALLQYLVFAPACSLLLSHNTARVHPLSNSGSKALRCLPLLWVIRITETFFLNRTIFPSWTFFCNTDLADEIFNPFQYEWLRDLAFGHPILMNMLPVFLWLQVYFYIERRGLRLESRRLERLERIENDEARLGRIIDPSTSAKQS